MKQKCRLRKISDVISRYPVIARNLAPAAGTCNPCPHAAVFVELKNSNNSLRYNAAKRTHCQLTLPILSENTVQSCKLCDITHGGNMACSRVESHLGPEYVQNLPRLMMILPCCFLAFPALSSGPPRAFTMLALNARVEDAREGKNAMRKAGGPPIYF